MAGKAVKVEDLLLDLENPRINRADSQREALRKIIEDQDVKLAALAQSIVEDGLNPMDRLLVIKGPERGKFIVIEGNRRLAALKLLNNPAVLRDLEVRPALQKRLEELSKAFDLRNVEPVDCYLLNDRADGATWIKQRHTGENQGRGIVDWNGVATARFRGRDPALQALDLVLKHGGLTDEEKQGIEDRFPITTLDRLLSTPAVRSKIGVGVQQEKLQTDLPLEEVIKPLRRIVRDLANGTVNVTMLKKKDQQVDWVSKLDKDLPDLTKKTGTLKPVEELEEQSAPPAPPTSPSPRPKPRPKPAVQKTLVPKDCRLNIANPKIAEIAKELRMLQLADYPHSISVLFRVFLEQSVDHCLTQAGIPLTVTTGGGKKDKNLRKKVEEAIGHLEAAGVPKKDLAGVSKGIDDKNSPLYVDTLHNYVHNRFYSPQERELKVAWNNAQLFFERIWL
jgi:hypothetical protein